MSSVKTSQQTILILLDHSYIFFFSVSRLSFCGVNDVGFGPTLLVTFSQKDAATSRLRTIHSLVFVFSFIQSLILATGS